MTDKQLIKKYYCNVDHKSISSQCSFDENGALVSWNVATLSDPTSFLNGWQVQYENERTLEQKNQREYAIRRSAADKLIDLVKPYSEEERETWPRQEKEAKEYLADPQATVSLITGIATARGISVADLVTKIMENITAFETAAGTIIGQQQKELDELQI
jgi:hypothetical protein